MLTVDVVIPCYGHAHTLARAVRSALAQPQVRQVIVVNDDSPDGVDDALEGMDDGTRVVILDLPQRRGAGHACNTGVSFSDADVIARLDADDEWQPGVLEEPLRLLEMAPHFGAVKLRIEPVGLADHYREHPRFGEVWQLFTRAAGGNLVIRRALYLAAGGMSDHHVFTRWGGEDGVLLNALMQVTTIPVMVSHTHPAVLHHIDDTSHVMRSLDQVLMGKPSPVPPSVTAHSRQLVKDKVAQLHSLYATMVTRQHGVVTL